MPLAETYLAALMAVATFRAADEARAWWRRRHPEPRPLGTNPFSMYGSESDDGNYATL